MNACRQASEEYLQTRGVSRAALARLQQLSTAHPYPLLFATISGAHLYGFPSPDSDYDLRGVHLLPLPDVVGLELGAETISRESREIGCEVDLVTHDARKFFALLLRKNGYVLEQLLSPLVVLSTPAHEELCALAKACITRHHVHHYLGFAATQWRLFEKEEPPRVKPLLYVYRVLLTGIHLMQTGTVEADLRRLNAEARMSHVDDLIARKQAEPEQTRLLASDRDFHAAEYARLTVALHEAHARSTLPEAPRAKAALHELLVRLRMSWRQ